MARFKREWSRREFLRRTGQAGALLAMSGSVASFIEACGSGSGSKTSSTVTTNLPAVPAVPSDIASVGKKYSGKSLVVSTDPVGIGGQIDKLVGAQLTKDTGIKVSYVTRPADTGATYAQYQRLLTSHSTTPDILMIDVVYPKAFAQYLAPMDSLPLLSDEARLQYTNIVDNDSANGKLLAMPWFGDFGLLYYRKDLLQKYGFANPPTTWQELTDQATKIQAGEQAGKANFYGFVFQGSAYEGLTCDALEWLASSGGGTFVKGSQVTVDNSDAISVLKLAQSWIGKIAPTGVTSFQEEDARNAFDAGNAAFMRNWPYAYAISADPKNSKVVGMFDAAALPHGASGQSSATVGGWQLGINGASNNKEAAAVYIAYATGKVMQKYRSIYGSFVPTMDSVATDPDVIKVAPYLAVQTTRVTRPSDLGTKYNQGSTFIYQAVNSILRGQDVSSTLSQLKGQLQGLLTS
jgi:trehalose/maltose transport system substrate-binding protein